MKKSVKIVLAAAVVTVFLLSAFGVGTVGAQSGGADRVVEDGEAVFLEEEDIDTEAGVFENLDPGEFTDADGRTLSFSNGVVDPSNDVSTYTATDPGTGDSLSVDVREARIQRIRPISPVSGARLDFPGTPRVRQGRNNLQFAVNYNYFESTEIDEELRQDGTEVTRIYLEQSQDRAVTGSRTEAADGTRYDAVFTFSIDDTGEYEFVAEPLTGDERPDGRDVGFGDREEASVSGSINVGFEDTQDDEDEEDGTDGQDDDGEMDDDMDEQEDENVTDGQDDDGEMDDDMDEQEDENVTDGQDDDGEMDDDMDEQEDENVTDGQDDDGEMDDDMDEEENENVTDGGGDEEEGDGGGSEGLPGFTAVAALLAIATAISVIARLET
jgi:AAA ATPase containing von Willebrand factor type A (vWA) domain